VKEENGELLPVSHNIGGTITSVSDVRQIEIHAAEPLAPAPSPSEVETAIVK
jgi:hypothetical protein